ncbi:hypothetical protein B4U84_28085 [Westiellopsis prolifica IICB1]|nr:hypothetical protein B4U84_28085 [Westiellopsis prolifica IICB1]
MKKILILSANPKDTNKLRLDEEVREIQAALERSRAREEFELITRWAVRIDDLRRALLDNEPQIVHFSGHATKNNGVDSNNNYEQHQRNAIRLNSQSGGIALENNSGQMQLVSTNSLATLFELCKDSIECVLLNACYSEAQAEAIYQHIDCVIGMERAITDKAAINFSVAFYDALGAGRNYADAFQFGCNNLDLNGIPESLTPKIKIRNNSKTLFIPNSKEKKAKMADRRIINVGSGNYNERIEGNYIQGNYYEKGQPQSLAEAAAEIKLLLKQLEQTYPTTTTSQQMIVAAEAINRIESNPTLKKRVVNAVKEGGLAAFEKAIDNPAGAFIVGAIKGWQEVEAQD